MLLALYLLLLLLKGGIQLLATQKPINRLGWWKGKFVLFQTLATGVGRAGICPKADSPCPAKQKMRAFIG